MTNKDSIKDFGKQFKLHRKIDGYWGSFEMLEDIVKPFNLNLLKNKVVCELGIGSGRILKNLSKLSPRKLYAIEPSESIEIAKENNKESKVNILFEKISGETIKYDQVFDYVLSIGVLHHTPNAEIICRNVYKSLKPKGKFIIWLYGKEGNELYIFIFDNLRKVTTLLPDIILNFISTILNFFLSFYIILCKFFNLPLRDYIINVLKKCSFEKRKYIIFDQLNPSYSKYYTKSDVEKLLTNSGFINIQLHNRYKYSWTAIAEK